MTHISGSTPVWWRLSDGRTLSCEVGSFVDAACSLHDAFVPNTPTWVWSSQGWTPVRAIHRVAPSSTTYRVLTSDGGVDVPSSSDMLLDDGTRVKACDLAPGMALRHAPAPPAVHEVEVPRPRYLTESELGYFWGGLWGAGYATRAPVKGRNTVRYTVCISSKHTLKTTPQFHSTMEVYGNRYMREKSGVSDKCINGHFYYYPETERVVFVGDDKKMYDHVMEEMYCPHNKRHKRVPPFIFGSSEKTRFAFVKAVCDTKGDLADFQRRDGGTIHASGMHAATDLAALIPTVGFSVTLNIHPRQPNNFTLTLTRKSASKRQRGMRTAVKKVVAVADEDAFRLETEAGEVCVGPGKLVVAS